MKDFERINEMKIFVNHGRTRMGFVHARLYTGNRKRKRSESVLVSGLNINHGLHRLASLTLAILGMVFSSYAGAVEATLPVFSLSLKHDGVRQSTGAETLTYSSQWDGGDGATVTIAQNGETVPSGKKWWVVDEG